MGVYSRFKKNPDGLRSLVELLESTPRERRQKMIEVGIQEDPDYTDRALALMLTFEDILQLPDGELAELTASSPPAVLAAAIFRQPEAVKERFLKATPPRQQGELRDAMEIEPELRAIGGAQLKLISIARQLEKKGFIQTKRIPLSSS